MNSSASLHADTKTVYSSLQTSYSSRARSLQATLGWLSAARLFLFIAFIFVIYQSFRTAHWAFISAAILFFVVFLLLLRRYDVIRQRTHFYKALADINARELAFLNGAPSTYAAGSEYIDPHHDYSYDLDLFGEGGLYGYLNRCSTAFGKDALANTLLNPDTSAIRERQQAVQELKEKLEFRQHLQAHGSLLDTKEKEMRQLKAWLEAPPSFRNRSVYYLLLLFPIASTVLLVYYLFTVQEWALDLFFKGFLLNLFITISFTRKIMLQLSVSTSVTKILQQFAGQLEQLEKASFQSPLLRQLKSELTQANMTSSQTMKRLASLFNYLETVVNLVVSTILNGLFLFHIHILYSLEKWKRQYGGRVLPWLKLLGEVEALNSLANLAYNNPAFCVPLVSERETLAADKMGHLLIREERRVTNSISLERQPFVILTGSNMSGKSTFLRTLGINLVLARAGSVVCASRFEFYPYSVHVSMRITDSLQDSESFFYAELKRLQSIIRQLESGEKTFVILDEILRGTNSNDKHSGTVGLIHKLVKARACGIIATHDLTVAALAAENPGYISAMCFESEIINDELVFDYRLKDGVCTKLSASFLLRKMGVIDEGSVKF